jgi:AcrR family transcriptional regulator
MRYRGDVGAGRREATRTIRVERVKTTARQLLARQGAANLSLREVAREMHQSSSALYRYFANRDELLTALIVDAYNDLGVSVERAEGRVARPDLAGRWRAACRAIRRWARAHPHEYALIFGSPVPGYQAPATTIVAASRVTAVLGGIVTDRYREGGGGGQSGQSGEARGGGRERRTQPAPFPTPLLDREAMAEALPGVPEEVALRAILVWAELFGIISFELFGHLVGSVTRPQALYEHLIDQTAAYLGITS